MGGGMYEHHRRPVTGALLPRSRVIRASSRDAKGAGPNRRSGFLTIAGCPCWPRARKVPGTVDAARRGPPGAGVRMRWMSGRSVHLGSPEGNRPRPGSSGALWACEARGRLVLPRC